MNYGLQMYSLRDITGENMALALSETAKMGYEFVEFAGFGGHTAEEIKAMLDENGLKAAGTHTGLGALDEENIDATIAYHKAIGCDDIIVPGADLSTKENIDLFLERMNYAEKKLNENGIKLGYHNHDREFKPNEDGLIPEYEILERSNITLEVDTYWVFNADVDPLEFIEKYKDRIRLIHLKDGLKGGVGKSLGDGEAPAAEVRKKALELGFKIIVESEGLDPTGLEEVKRCADFLKAEDAKEAE